MPKWFRWLEAWAKSFSWMFGMVLAILTVVSVLPLLSGRNGLILLIALILFLVAATAVFVLEKWQLRSERAQENKVETGENAEIDGERLTNNLSPKQIARLWEWALHEDNLFTNRGNFIMIAEAMLFTAFATLLVDSSPNRGAITLIGITGMLVSLVWLYISTVQNLRTMHPIKAILRQKVDEYRFVASKRYGQKGSGIKLLPIHILMGTILPALLTVLWLMLLLFARG